MVAYELCQDPHIGIVAAAGRKADDNDGLAFIEVSGPSKHWRNKESDCRQRAEM
jgi:hypothetical protein